MISFLRKSASRAELVLFNTLGRKKEPFRPLKGKYVGMYTCGPTVYNYAHIGNLRAYVTADLLRRTLEYAGHEVKQIVNITDVGHLVGDGDDGEDKMTAGLKREGMELTLENMKFLGEKYAEAFIEDLKALNIELPFSFPRASENIPEQIAYVESLLDKGYAYKASDGVYFDTRKYKDYGALGGSASREHSRIGVSGDKHDPRDFLLWRFDSLAGWDTPWGKGFPGWHIECTAMATKFLGKSFDIHTGGIDHIAVHHNNEIAQTEAATGKKFVNYWVHTEFLVIDSQKIAKSIGNTIMLSQVRDRGISPLSYRYWLLTSHYRSQLNFTWDAVVAAQTARERALRLYNDLPKGSDTNGAELVDESYREKFRAVLYDDLNSAEAIALMWDLLKDDGVSAPSKRATLREFDRVLAIGFSSDDMGTIGRLKVIAKADIPGDVQKLIEEREGARRASDWTKADNLRTEIVTKGYDVLDTPEGPTVRPHTPDAHI